jgi:type IV pilus assembly protein PilM
MKALNFTTSKIFPIGLDIGRDSIKMVQLGQTQDTITVQAYEKIRIENTNEITDDKRSNLLVESINDIMSRGVFRHNNVVTCIPDNCLKVTSLRITAEESDRPEDVLKQKAVTRLGLDPEKQTIKYIHAGTIRQGEELKSELIIFAVDNQAIREHIILLEKANLNPVSIDVTPCAIFRAFERFHRRHEDKEKTNVFIDIGQCTTNVVFSRGCDICFVKQIPIGGKNIDQKLGQRLGIKTSKANLLRLKLQEENVNRETNLDDADSYLTKLNIDDSTRQTVIDVISRVSEQLSNEIALCARYYTVTFRGNRVEKAIVSGGEAYEHILINVLKRHLTAEVEIAKPLQGLDRQNARFDANRRGLLSEWTVAAGLGLKGWNAKNRKSNSYAGN